MSRLAAFVRDSGLHGAWIAIWSVVGWVATAGAPFMLDSPFLLMVLAPRTAFVLLAAPTVGLVWFVVLGTLRLSITDASWFLVGRRVPQWTAARSEVEGSAVENANVSRWRRPMRLSKTLMTWLCRSAPLAFLVLFLRPNGRYLGVAGAFGVGPRIAGVSSVSGTITYLVAVHLGVGQFLV